MKILSDNFLSLLLLLILAVSPVQNTIASINHTMTMANTELATMQPVMSVSSATDIQENHCNGHQTGSCKCDMSHCTNVSFIILPITTHTNLNFAQVNYPIRSGFNHIQSLVTSLFRPPRI